MLFGKCPWFLPHLNSGSLTPECSQQFTPGMTVYENELASVFLKYGQSTRTCISVAGNQVAEGNLNAKILQAIGEFPAGTSWLTSPETVSHALFSVQPNSHRGIGTPIPAPRYISGLLFDKVAEEKSSRCCRCFCACLCSGQVLGSYSNCLPSPLYKRRGGKYDITPIHASDDTNTNLVVVPAGNTSRSVLSFEKDSELEALSSLHPGKVTLPISSTFPTVDRVLFDVHGCVWLFQPTAAEDHVLRTSGLQRLKKALPDKYQPMKNKKWKIVIIKLETECFNAAPFKGNKKAFWDLYVERYIMNISLDTLFNDK